MYYGQKYGIYTVHDREKFADKLTKRRQVSLPFSFSLSISYIIFFIIIVSPSSMLFLSFFYLPERDGDRDREIGRDKSIDKQTERRSVWQRIGR